LDKDELKKTRLEEDDGEVRELQYKEEVKSNIVWRKGHQQEKE
jgi:hypothetical protein